MTPYEGELLTKYLTHLIILGEYGDFADFEEWYQLIRYTNGAGTPRTVEEVSELRYKGVLEAACQWRGDSGPFGGVKLYHPR